MNQAIVTLPISPVESPHLGLCLMPLLMDLLGKSLGLKKVLALNIQGLKYSITSSQAEKIKIAHRYLLSLDKLSIYPDYVWRDDLNEFADFAQSAMVDLLCRNLLIVEKKSIIRCDCGRVEYLDGANSFSLQRRLFYEEGSNKFCKLCHSRLHVKEKEVCLFPFKLLEHQVSGLPVSANREFKNLVSSFTGIQYLVSRTRVTNFSLNLPNLKDFDIDPDFLWSFMLPFLNSKGYDVRFLVASRKSMLACLTMMAVGRAFDSGDPVIIFPPYLVGPKRLNVKTFGSVEQMVALFGKEAIKCFMISGLNWGVSESVIDPVYLNYLRSKNPILLQEIILSILPNSSCDIMRLSGFNLSKALKV